VKKPFSPRKLLLPLVPAYRLALLLREVGLRTGMVPVRRLRFPVVSIGSLSVGGAGKTPLTIALTQALERRGMRVDVLTRGYGRQGQRPARVTPNGTTEEFGDEPLLIARETGVPVYIAAQRYDAGQLAEAGQSSGVEGSGMVGQGFSPDTNPVKTKGALAPEVYIHLLDDGFQHRQLHRDVDILLLDQCDWHDGLLPAGNLREPPQAVRRATVIAIPADNPELEADLRAWGWQGPIWRLHRKMEVSAVEGPVAAFCGIARPEQFFAGLEVAGLRLAARFSFPDHYRYTANDLKRMVTAARSAAATALITTEKDQARLGKLSAAFPESLPLKTVRLRVEIVDESAAINWLVDRLKSAPALPSL
jgi:tetraacyldisaccharide 4'-kinase